MRRTTIWFAFVFWVTWHMPATAQTCDTNQQISDGGEGYRISVGPIVRKNVNGKKMTFIGDFGWVFNDRDFEDKLKKIKSETFEVWITTRDVIAVSDLPRPRLYGRLIRYYGKDEPKWEVDRVFELALQLGYVMSLNSCLTNFLEDRHSQMVSIVIRPEFKEP